MAPRGPGALAPQHHAGVGVSVAPAPADLRRIALKKRGAAGRNKPGDDAMSFCRCCTPRG
jgi:hypothetical protein